MTFLKICCILLPTQEQAAKELTCREKGRARHVDQGQREWQGQGSLDLGRDAEAPHPHGQARPSRRDPELGLPLDQRRLALN